MTGWIKTFENVNLELWECDTCNNPNHNYIVLKCGILQDKRSKNVLL